MAAANDLLRAARERTASPANPEDGLTREELAELVNAYIWEHHHKMVALDANHLGKMERGIVSWPSKLYREALRAILGAPTDAALGFINTRRTVVKLDNVDRKQFLCSAAFGGLIAGPLAALLEGGGPTPIPVRVGATDIAQVRAATEVFRSGFNFTYGGALARETVRAQLRWSAGLLEARCSARLRPELFSAVGDLSGMAGFIAFDQAAHEEARRAFQFALACAEQADDWHLRAFILSGMGNQALWIGQPDEALTLTDQALVRADRLTATERAYLHTGRCRALGKMRRVRDTLIATGTADDHFAHANPANDPPYLFTYNAARHAQLAGLGLADLALSGRDPREATERLTAAVAGLAPRDAHARVISQAKLAGLMMATGGDPLEAVALGTAALETFGTIDSRRILDGLRELNRHAAAHQIIAEVAHLRHRIGTLVLAA
ncbi:MAG: XRE family transcriptional regulator [Pseudonocardiaceae bacterium]